ncbi:excalibur calcium-binding domain-containing protein [Streptomyces sp. NPDC048560]|uniref:excalibur calcium-binding domain-containing protein n=1 Tax=Streptomyces sp. NPDC048560 TaxID=3155488 RepID=UPI003420928D
MPTRRWWQHPAFVITALVLFPPGGIALAWLSHWSKAKKIVATVLAGLWFLAPFLGDPPKDPKDDAKPKAAATVTPSARPAPSEPPNLVGKNLKEAKAAAGTAGYNATSHDASDDNAGQWDDDNWKVCFQTSVDRQAGKKPTLDFGVVRNEVPCPAKDGEKIPWPKMPGVTGMTFEKASETLKPIGFKEIEPASAYTDVTLPGAVDDWKVCFQEPEAAEEIQSPEVETARLMLTSPSTACPKSPHTELHPAPEAPDVPEPEDDDSSSSGGSSSTSGSGGGGSTYYKNCTAVRAAGAAPIRQGDPGFGSHLDRDGDGVACE